MGEGANLVIVADGRVAGHAVGKHMRALTYHGVGENGAVVDARGRTDLCSAAQDDIAADLGIGRNGHGGLYYDVVRGVEGGVVHVLAHDATSKDALGGDQLRAVVDPGHLLGGN